jgi:hypothetical protein
MFDDPRAGVAASGSGGGLVSERDGARQSRNLRSTVSPVRAQLSCDACGALAGTYDSYEAWADAASARGWVTGEDTVICAACLAVADGSTTPVEDVAQVVLKF